MERKTSAYYQRLHRQRLRDRGLVKKELWILPEYGQDLLAVEQQMRQPRGAQPLTKDGMMNQTAPWTIDSLQEALQQSDLVKSDAAVLELLDGAEASLLITMKEYGDLPLFLAVAGRQIVVEAYLWPTSQVRDTISFNEQILRMQKVFPLSTVALESFANGEAAYMVFGALSAASSLANVVFEIETLSDNVIKLTEAFEPLLLTA
ncbi:hypothetical protein SAMN02745117_00755 [Lampropedia hyalina DSM 16112]|jgi:uncharacterized protein YjfI (DUF2170 family)|uniref:DUF2170 domain-containing protein n=1 Tax=Lampropedia hyalina DSM 16112 TaxID=1122156 RepID=A0A1M4VXN8_9BURK|nr:YjfI family protein [Lampropedia hyalina]SHE73660.1 hypothetical protein SAMN02745117_00755 [Lampropedia hyalina DSM 16112]